MGSTGHKCEQSGIYKSQCCGYEIALSKGDGDLHDLRYGLVEQERRLPSPLRNARARKRTASLRSSRLPDAVAVLPRERRIQIEETPHRRLYFLSQRETLIVAQGTVGESFRPSEHHRRSCADRVYESLSLPRTSRLQRFETQAHRMRQDGQRWP